MNAGDRCGACVFICNHKEENMVLNTSKSMLDKIAWLNKQEDITKFSKLQLQKFLFLYEMFQFVEKKDSDFTYLKAYKNGPVFSNFYGDITYREAEVQDYLKQKQCDFDIDESNARISQFIINTLTDSELSDLTHQFKMWSTHKEEIDAGKKQIPMSEKDITDDDIEILDLLKSSEPDYDYEILRINQKNFVFSKEDFMNLNEEHLELLDSLSTNEELLNPVYVEVESSGRLVID